MAAGMHRAVYCGFIIQSGVFVQWQGIHIAAQQHSPAIGRAAQYGDQACGRWALAKLQWQTRQRSFDFCQCFGVMQSQFRLAVDITAQRDQIGKKALGVIAPDIGEGGRVSQCHMTLSNTPIAQSPIWLNRLCRQPHSVPDRRDGGYRVGYYSCLRTLPF